MERNREGRRGTMAAAVNGGGAAAPGGISRRRPRNGSYRDSTDEDGAVEMQEMGRLPDRASKMDRDRDRSGWSKRRRGDRALHAASNTSDDTDNSDGDFDDEGPPSLRLPTPQQLKSGPSVSTSHEHHRKSFPAKPVRPASVSLKPADEMIGVPVPRKARSSATKRSQEFPGGGGCGGGGSELIYRPALSPAGLSSSSATQISPPVSGASAKKKMKQIGGAKQRPSKTSKSPSVSEDLEIEVAEVLFGLTRQFESRPEPDANGSSNEAKSVISSPIATTQTAPPQTAASQQPLILAPPNLSSNAPPLSAIAPKRKRPRIVKLEDEIPANPVSSAVPPTASSSSAAHMDTELPVKVKAASPTSEKNAAVPITGIGGAQIDLGVSVTGAMHLDTTRDSLKLATNSVPDLKISTGDSDDLDQNDTRQHATSPVKERAQLGLDLDSVEIVRADQSPRNVKFSIDLMVTPSGKSSQEREGLSDILSADLITQDTSIQMRVENQEVKVNLSTKMDAGNSVTEARNVVTSTPKDGIDLEKQSAEERKVELRLNLDNQEKGKLEIVKEQAQKQLPKEAVLELGIEKAEPSSSLPLPLPASGLPGRPGNFPPFGDMGQVPSLKQATPPEGNAGSSKPEQKPNFLDSNLRPKRCAKHCYIAHNIQYHQQLPKMNTYWPSATGTTPNYGTKHCDLSMAKHYNLNVVPPIESSVDGNSVQGNIATRNLGSVKEKNGQLAAIYPGHSTKEKSASSNAFAEAAQRKQQIVLPQAPEPGPAANILHGPTYIFPINQQQAAPAATHSEASKTATGAGNVDTSSVSASSVAGSSGARGPATTLNFSYPLFPANEAQYMAILQSNGYPFPIPAQVGAPPAYRGGSTAQPAPFLNGPFYSSQMLHPQFQLQQQHQQQQQQLQHQQHQQLQQQQPQQQQKQQQQQQQPSHSHAQQEHHRQAQQKASTSSGSSSAQKSQRHLPGGRGSGPTGNVGSSQGFPASKQQWHHSQIQCEVVNEDNPSTDESRVLRAQKNLYGHNLAMAMNPQNFALISPAAAAALGVAGGDHNEKQLPTSQHQPMKMDHATSQPFAVSFTSFAGAPQSLDFSSMAQNHALLQNLPEAAKHGYNISTAFASAASSQASQHRKATLRQIAEDGKSAGDSMNASTSEEERKIMGTSKGLGSVSHGPPTNGSRLSNRPASAAPATSSSATTSNKPPNSQFQQQQPQQQHLIQLQKHQMEQQQLHMQHQFVNRSTKSSTATSSSTMYSDRLPAGSTMSKFPQALAGFPQAFMQSSGTAQSPQWKSSSRAATPAPTASPSMSSSKNHQQGMNLQQPLLVPSHHTQISFGMNPSKAAAASAAQQHLSGGNSNPSLSSPPAAAAAVVGSPQSSVSKSAGGSPRFSSGAKPGPSQATVLPAHHHHHQQSAKNSPSSNSTLKSLNNSSILGHPPMNAAQNSNSKQQQQQLPKQHFPQGQFFFSNTAYVPAQPSQSNGASAAGYYQQRRQAEQLQQQQHDLNSARGSSVNPPPVAVTSAPSTSGPAKAGSMKPMAAPGTPQQPVQFAASSQPFMSAAAAAAAFSYIHAVSAGQVSAKLSDQKPAAGNNLNPNLHKFM